MKKLRVVLTVLWMGFIFYQGTQTGEVSIETSDKIVNPLVDIIEHVKPVEEEKESVKEQENQNETEHEQTATKEEPSKSHETLYKMVHYLVRKSAHFLEYGILAALTYWTFKGFNVNKLDQVVYSLFMVLSVAVMDEYLQSFVERTSSVSDVLIDFLGGITGILIFVLGNWIFTTCLRK